MTMLRSELVKVSTTWVWWGVLLIALAFAALNVGLIGALAPTEPSDPAAASTGLPVVTTEEGQVAVLGFGYQTGYLFSAVLGTIIGASDYRHRTATPTFLAAPRRGRVAAAKLVTSAAVGVVYGIVVQLAALALLLALLALRGVDVVDAGAFTRSIVLGVLGIAVWAVIGTSIGLLLRNQVAAIVLVVVLLFVLDPLASLGLAALGERWGVDWAAASAYTLTNATTAVVSGFATGQLLRWWTGLLVLLGWALALTGLAWGTTLRRDVT